MRVAREQRETIRKREWCEGRSSAGCGVATDRQRDRKCAESADLQQTCFVLSMDPRHTGALSGTSGDPLEIISKLDSDHWAIVGFIKANK